MPLVPVRLPTPPRSNDPIVQWSITARSLLNQHGLHNWQFDYDRAKRRAGACFHRSQTITLSRHYVLHNTDKPDDIRDTILHEIAHALAGPGIGHGQEWKDICVRIGARPIRCYDSQKIAMPKESLQAACGVCQRIYTRHKQPPRNTYRYCIPCGKDKGRLTFTKG